mgnify:CR=1 FL=1
MISCELFNTSAILAVWRGLIWTISYPPSPLHVSSLLTADTRRVKSVKYAAAINYSIIVYTSQCKNQIFAHNLNDSTSIVKKTLNCTVSNFKLYGEFAAESYVMILKQHVVKICSQSIQNNSLLFFHILIAFIFRSVGTPMNAL